MSQLPPLDIKIPPKPNAEQTETTEPSDQPPVNTPPARGGSKVGRAISWSCGGCFVIALIAVVVIIASINNSIQNFSKWGNQEPPLTQEELANQALSEEYKSAFQSEQTNLPHFLNWTNAFGSAGIPCSSAIDSCLLGDTGSTTGLEGVKGPSKLKVSDASMICEEVSKVAKTLGATEDKILNETSAVPLGDKSIARCVSMMTANSRTVGFGWWSPSYFLLGKTVKGAPFGIQLGMFRESHGSGNITKGGEYISYWLTTSTLFDSPNPQDDPEMFKAMKSGTRQANALLDTLAYVRRANYDSAKATNPSPFSPQIADWAMQNFNKYFKHDSKLKFVTGSDGLVHWFQVNASDGFDACVSTGTEKDVNADTIPSGNTGITDLNNEIEGPSSTAALGDYYRGACHN